MHAAIAEVTTRFGNDVTVAFFPDKSRKAKQLRMYGKSMKDFMPVISEEHDPSVHRYAHTADCQLATMTADCKVCTATATAPAPPHMQYVVFD
jgi:hypothetical protein